MKRIVCENGHRYEITEEAYERLAAALNARQADDAFEGFAAHVPKRDRCQVWMKCS